MPGTALSVEVYSDEQKKTYSCTFGGGERAVQPKKKKNYTNKWTAATLSHATKKRCVVFKINQQTYLELRE